MLVVSLIGLTCGGLVTAYPNYLTHYIMGKNLSIDQIAVITALCKAGHPNPYIAKQTGLAKIIIQH